MTETSSSSQVRAWRTAFLSLRDEIVSVSSPPQPPSQLLDKLIFPHSSAFVSASAELPPHEVTSDLLFLMEVITNSNAKASFTQLSRLIHEICHRVSLQLSSSSWCLLLQCIGTLIEFFVRRASTLSQSLFECLSTLRCLVSGYRGKISHSDDIQLAKLLLRTVASSHSEMISSSHFTRGSQRDFSEPGKRIPQSSASLWEVQTISLTMLPETITRLGSFPDDIWKQTIEGFRKVMDLIAAKRTLVEENSMSRFYEALLRCLHLVLKDPKGSMSDHVSSFVSALRMFFTYGINSSTPQLANPVNGQMEKELGLNTSPFKEPKRTDHGAYRPPHLRNRDISYKNHTASSSQSFSDHESSRQDFASSDSDYSDSDGPVRDNDSVRKSKIRVAAIECIQYLCQADPKLFTSQWTLLLPTSEVLQSRKFEATLMTCLIFDPYLKVRIASATTLAAMLDGASSAFLQIAEYKEPSKFGSFTALSVSLGHILNQLHTGILYLIQRESHGRLLVSLFKILMVLISSTPYSRMPNDLLPTVVTSLQDKIEVGFPFKSDQTGLLSACISCLSVAFSTTPSSLEVKEILIKEASLGSCQFETKSNVLSALFMYSEQTSNPAVCLEALQALRAVSHNYPSIMVYCWERVSIMIHGFLKTAKNEVNTRPWRGHVINTTATIGEKILTAAIKVLDTCLRAISGFKGTEDLLEEKLLESPFTADNTRMTKVSSAPQTEPGISEDGSSNTLSGIVQWSDALEKHIPLILKHSSPMVRAASVTCFAGLTSSVFSFLVNEEQEFILSSLIYAVKHDEVPSVRSAACRAIGVVSCFPQAFQSVEILGKFIHAIEINTRDPSAAVRITASWALANICDSCRHCIAAFALEESTDYNAISQSLELLISCALRLSNDGDKIKSNAVRALGNLSRFIKCTSSSALCDKMDKTRPSLKTNRSEEYPSSSNQINYNRCSSNLGHSSSLGDSCCLGRIVQALISCVTTGNVKVQWNVCHALSSLFLNESLRLQEMDWAPSVFSILLLLLRDSSNFKIRIQAAAALSVPSSVPDYGNSYSDVVHGLVHLVENLDSDHNLAPSSFKYKVALEKQVNSTLLHLLGLVSSTDQEPLKDFLVKKASILEEWLKTLCSEFVPSSSSDYKVNDEKSVGEASISEGKSIGEQKKAMISKATSSLSEVFKGKKQYAIAVKFEKLEEGIR